jgi:hypothetical protein
MSVVMKPFFNRSGNTIVTSRVSVRCVYVRILNLRLCTRTCLNALKETSDGFRQDTPCSGENRFGPLSSASETLAAKATLLG